MSSFSTYFYVCSCTRKLSEIFFFYHFFCLFLRVLMYNLYSETRIIKHRYRLFSLSVFLQEFHVKFLLCASQPPKFARKKIGFLCTTATPHLQAKLTIFGTSQKTHQISPTHSQGDNINSITHPLSNTKTTNNNNVSIPFVAYRCADCFSNICLIVVYILTLFALTVVPELFLFFYFSLKKIIQWIDLVERNTSSKFYFKLCAVLRLEAISVRIISPSICVSKQHKTCGKFKRTVFRASASLAGLLQGFNCFCPQL